MRFLKRLGVGVLAFLFSLCLGGMVASTVFSATVGRPENLKSWLDKNNVYGAVVNSTLDNTLKNAKGSGSSLNQPEVQSIIKKTFTPTLVKSIAEQVIDGTDNWLLGKADKPDFVIDLAPVKQTLAEESGNALVNRLNSLPVCSAAELRAISPGTDPFAIFCRPAGTNVNAEWQKVVQDVLGNKDLFGELVITADTIKAEGNDKPIYKQVEGLPGIYQFSQKAPWIFGLLSVLLATGVVFMSDTKRKGLRRIARSLTGSGIFLVISVVIVNILTKWISSNKNLIKEASADLQSALLGLGNSVASSINGILIIFGATFIVLGGATLIYLYRTKPPKIIPETPDQPINLESVNTKPEQK